MEAEKNVERNDLRNIIRCETEFHEILYRSTKSEIFYRTISGLVDKFQWIRAIALVTPGGSRESLDHHKKILAAIERKDSEKHKELMELHLQRAAETYALSPVTNLLNRNLKGKLGK
jgi:DNA-binding GntR family transcriptional regulator